MSVGLIMDLECECGEISHINTSKCDKFICPKCKKVVFENIDEKEFKGDGKRVNFRFRKG